MRFLIMCLIGGVCCQTGSVFADDYIDRLAPKKEKFIELNISLPPYPQESALQTVPIDNRNAGFQYSVDVNSLSVGSDGVTRYTMVVKSPSGSSNVFYEGVRCDTAEYKTYAYGTTAGTFLPLRNASWKPIVSGDNRHYQQDLAKNFLCNPSGGPYKRAIVINRFQNFQDESTDLLQ